MTSTNANQGNNVSHPFMGESMYSPEYRPESDGDSVPPIPMIESVEAPRARLAWNAQDPGVTGYLMGRNRENLKRITSEMEKVSPGCGARIDPLFVKSRNGRDQRTGVFLILARVSDGIGESPLRIAVRELEKLEKLLVDYDMMIGYHNPS